MSKKRGIFSYIRSRAFRNYLFSFVGIFLIVLSLLSIMAMRYAADNMKKENIRIMESKLFTIAEDLDMQAESMRKIALEVASRQEFRPDYLKSGKYKEVELLERLKGYNQMVNICEYYFIKYRGEDKVFNSSGTTMPINLLLSKRFGKGNIEEIALIIEESCMESRESLLCYRQDNISLFIYPMKTYALVESGREGMLCFLVSEKMLLERMEKIVGIMPGKFSVLYNDFCILGDVPAETEETLMQVSQNNNFQIYFAMDENSYFSWSNVLTRNMWIAFLGIVLLFLGLGVFLAFWNFKPLRKITEKYRTTADGELVPDWDSIDALIESLWRGKETNRQLLQDQYRVLREQTIQLIASGGYSDKVKEHMELLNIRLDGNVFGIIRCSFGDGWKPDALNEDLYKGVEDLSGDGEKLYPYWNRDGELCVLAAVEEEYQLEETAELIQSLFDARETAVQLEIAVRTRDLRQLSVKKQEEGAAPAQESENNIELEAEEGLDAGRNTTAMTVVEYIRENCTDYNLSLDLLAQEFQITPQYLCKIIKLETGVSYKEYLTGLRMEAAKRLLKDKNISVIDTCQQAGYNNVSYFIKVFQKYTGVTPAKYRDEH